MNSCEPLDGFQTQERSGENIDIAEYKNNIQFILSGNHLKDTYKKLLTDLSTARLDNNPNNREESIFPYMEKMFHRFIKIGIQNIIKGKQIEGKEKISASGQKYKKNHTIEKNYRLVQKFLYPDQENTREQVFNPEKYGEKFNRYYPMYEIALAKRFQKDIIQLDGEITDEIFKNIISNIIESFLYILYAFGDKLSTCQMEDILSSSSHASIRGFTKQIVSRYDNLSDNGDLIHMYKSFSLEGLTEQESAITFSNTTILPKIEAHFDETLISLADIYKHWYYSTEAKACDLQGIKAEMNYFISNILEIKSNSIGFLDQEVENIEAYILDKNKPDLQKLLNLPHEFDSFCNLFSQKYNDTQIHSLSAETQTERNKSLATVDFSEIGSIGVDEITFDDYSNAGPLERKRYFLRNIFHVGHINDIPNLANSIPKDYNSQYFSDFCNVYRSTYARHNISEQKIQNMFEEIRLLSNNNTMDLEVFESQYIEYEQLIVGWFRFGLITKKYISLDEDEKQKQIQKEFTKSYGVSEVIRYKLDELLVSGRNIQMISGHMKNSSVLDVPAVLQLHKKRFSHRKIDFDNQEIFGFTVENKNILFKNISELYLPDNIQASIADINSYMTQSLDTITLLSQRKEIPESGQKYIAKLHTAGIDINDFIKLGKLRKFVKYIHHNLDDIKTLLVRSKEERKFLEDNKHILGEDFEIGSEKTPYRVVQKFVSSYSGDMRELGDLVRMRKVDPSLIGTVDDLVLFIGTISENEELNSNVRQIIIEDNTGNPGERSKKPSGYRDISVQLKLNSGNLVEIQFITQDIFDWKVQGIAHNILRDRYIKNNIALSQDNIELLEKNAIIHHMKIPHFIKDLSLDDHKSSAEYLYSDEVPMSSDWFYDMSRGNENNPEYVQVLNQMESIPNLLAWGKVQCDISKEILENKE